MSRDDEQVREHVGRVEALLAALESGTTGVQALEVVRAVVRLYGDGLARVMRAAEKADCPALFDLLAEDELVSHLLLVHDLHPVDVLTRVQQAVRTAREVLRLDGPIEVISVSGGTLRVRCTIHGCGATIQRVREVIGQSMDALAPEIECIEIEETPRAVSVIPADTLFSRGE